MRALIATFAVFALAGLAVSAAPAAEPTTPNPAKACKTERKADAKLFAEMYKASGTSKKKPYPTCIATKKQQAQELADAVADASKNAAKWCKAERAKDPSAFAEAYGTNANKKNAFGKCVSQKARDLVDEAEDEAEAEVKDARVEACKALKRSQPAEFKQAYKNLRGCVLAQPTS